MTDGPGSEALGGFWVPALSVAVAIFVVAMDQMMLPVGAPAIAADLETNVGGIQAAIAVASLVAAPLYFAARKLATKFGSKTIFMIGLGCYAAGSVIGASATSLGVLILGWSVIRGVGLVASIPAGLGLLAVNYEGKQRTAAFAMYGAAGVFAALVAPLLMGFAAQELTWRLPLVVIAGLAGLALVLSIRSRDSKHDREVAIDWGGTAVVGLAGGSLILAGLLGTRHGWWDARRPFAIGDVEISPFGLSPAPWLFLIGLVLSAIAVAWFSRRAIVGGSPLFDPKIFQNRVFSIAFPMTALLFLLSGAIPFTVPVFLQGGAGFGAVGAGLVMAVFAAGSMILAFLSGRLLEVLSPRVLMQVAIVTLAIGLGWLAFVARTDVTYWSIAAPMFLIGMAFGVIASQAPGIQMSALEPEQVGEGSGLVELGKEVGIGLGTAFIGGVLLSASLTYAVDGVLRHAEFDLPASEREAIVSEIEDHGGIDAIDEADVPESVRQAIAIEAPEAYSDGMRLAIGAMFVVVLGAFVFSSLIPGIEPMDVTEEEVRHAVADVTARRS